jgi:hypothetical protein
MKEGVELSPLLPTPPQPPQAAPLAGKRRLWPTSGASGRKDDEAKKETFRADFHFAKGTTR